VPVSPDGHAIVSAPDFAPKPAFAGLLLEGKLLTPSAVGVVLASITTARGRAGGLRVAL